MNTLTEPVQNTEKRRSKEQKVGRVKYTLQLVKAIQADIREVKLTQRTIMAGLKGLFNFQKPMLQRIACQDEIDIEILDLLYETGSQGLLPKDLASRLSNYKIERHHVSRRLVRMNKRLENEIGEKLVEHRGWHWALTSFAIDVWGEESE